MVENTACCHYWGRSFHADKRALCSQCDPTIGKWHGLFQRRMTAEHGYVKDAQGRLEPPGGWK